MAGLAYPALAADSSIPALDTVQIAVPTAAEFFPLTRSERLRNYLLSVSSPQSIFAAAASAGIRQATNSPKEWQGGAEGYGYRLGDAVAKHIMRRTLEYGASAALHEDNRYLVSAQHGFLRRTEYAIASTFVARHDNGRRGIAFSRIGAAAGTSFISRFWQPPSTTTAGDGAVSFGISMATDVGFNVVREFWPDVKRRFRPGRF